MFAPWVEQAGRAYQMPQLTVTGHHSDGGVDGDGGDGDGDGVDQGHVIDEEQEEELTFTIYFFNSNRPSHPVFGICALIGAALAVWLPETQGR